MADDLQKQCSKCKEFKDLSEFHNRKDTKDGKEFTCKACRNEKYKAKYVKKRISMPKTKEQLAAEKREKYRLNPEKYKEINREWVSRNWEKRKAYNRMFVSSRRVLKCNATLQGFSKEIRSIYKNCPVGYEVDHIVPLKGKIVCGLHVPWNLQYLTVTENRKKGNKFIGL